MTKDEIIAKSKEFILNKHGRNVCSYCYRELGNHGQDVNICKYCQEKPEIKALNIKAFYEEWEDPHYWATHSE